MCAAVWLVRPVCLQSADLCLSPQLSLSGNLRQIIQTNLYVWPLHLRAFTMLIYADCWLWWWLLSDKTGSLVNKTKRREERQTGQGSYSPYMQSSPSDDPPLKPPNTSFFVQILSYQTMMPWSCFLASKNVNFNSGWRVFPRKPECVCDVFPSKGCIGCSSKGQEVIKSESLNFGQKDVDSWRWILMMWQKRQKKKNPYWTMIEAIFCHCFIIYLIILKSNSNSSKRMPLHCMQIRFISNCVIFDLGAQIFKFRLTDHSLIGLLL